MEDYTLRKNKCSLGSLMLGRLVVYNNVSHARINSVGYQERQVAIATCNGYQGYQCSIMFTIATVVT